MDDGGKLPLMAQQPPDEEIGDALRIAKNPVRYDTGPQPGEETIRPYGPTIKDQIYQTVAGTESRPSAERANFARGVSQLAEYTPFLGNAMAGQEAYRRGDTKGMLMSVVPMPGGARAGGVVRGVEEEVVQKPLMAIHNTTLDNLALAESAGGFPATSTAIKDTVSPYRGFGDISLIGDKEFAYPSKMQRIFAGDPYTPNPVLRNRPASKIAEEVASIPHRLEPEKVFTPAMVRAVLTPEFNSFQDIKGKSYLLGSREREGKFVDSFDGYMKDLGERMLPFYKGESSFPEISFYRSLVDPKHRAANFRKLPEDIEQEIAALPSMVEKAPQEYFESKNYGAANIGPGYVSYKGAIIPEGQVSAAQDILNKLGIDDIVPVKSFYHGDDLSKAYEKFKHLHFSTGGTASGTMNDDIKSALRLANSRLGRDHDQIDSAESNFPPVIDDANTAGEEANPHDIEFTPEELELLNSLQDYVEAPVEAAQNIAPQEPAPAQEIPERKLGGKINTIIDRDPDWRMGVEEGGVVDRALKLSRDHMAYGGLPDDYMKDDRYKAFQEMGGTRVDPRSEAIGRYLPKMTYHESRDNPLAGAKTSSAAGLAQFTRPTWRKITEGEPEVAGKSREELYAMRRDPSEEGQRFHMRMAEKLTNENANKLEQAGLPVTPQNLYAAHFGGPHGIQAAAAPAGTPLSRIFSRAEINANPFLRGRTAEGFRKFTQSAMSETPRGLPTDMDFQRSQLPANRYEGLQTAMAGAQPQTQPTPPTQMAYAKPAQRGFSPDLMTPRPSPQPTQMARLPDMNVGNQRVVASDNMPRQQMAATQPSISQPEAPQTPTPEPEMPNRDMMEGIEQPFFGLPDFDIAGLFADGGAVEEALHLATGGRTPAWTRAAGKAESGGLNAKGRASYNRANPGKPGLKPPAPHPKTEKDAGRRKSFCSRMKGMKEKLTSAETARDPDSRINKSLRAWNCADGGQVWDKPRPKSLGEPKPLSDKQKKSAKAAAKAAGRPYPNFVDNVRAAQKRK